MLAVVENVRRKQLAWIQAILAARNWKPTTLARAAGVDHSTISKFLNDRLNVAQLNTTTVEKIAAAGGIPPYETSVPGQPRGLAEREAEPYEAMRAADAILGSAIEAVRAGRNGLDPWVLRSRALEAAGYMPGDVLMVDLNGLPEDGDAVCAQVYDKAGKAETVMRIYEKPFLVPATFDRTVRRPLLVDDDNVIIRGVVVATLRPRRAA